MAVFETATYYTLTLDTNIDLSTATTHDIVYKKPDESTGTWTGTVTDTTKIQYSVQSGDLDQHGLWRVQAKVTDGGLNGFGDIVLIQVNELL